MVYNGGKGGMGAYTEPLVGEQGLHRSSAMVWQMGDNGIGGKRSGRGTHRAPSMRWGGGTFRESLKRSGWQGACGKDGGMNVVLGACNALCILKLQGS